MIFSESYLFVLDHQLVPCRSNCSHPSNITEVEAAHLPIMGTNGLTERKKSGLARHLSCRAE